MEAVLTNSDAKIYATFLDGDGAAVAPTNPTVTITRDSDGAEIETDTGATDEGDGLVSFTLDGTDIPAVDLLRASWGADDASAPDSEVSVVGGFLCSLEAISAAVVATGAAAPAAAELRAKRAAAERKLEDACGVAFRPSYTRESFRGEGGSDVLLARPLARSVIAASIGGTDLTLSDLVLSRDLLRYSGRWTRDALVEIAYEHGFPAPPETISRAALILAASYIADAGGERISRFSEDGQEFFLSLPGNGRDTGIPEVDQAISDHRFVTVA